MSHATIRVAFFFVFFGVLATAQTRPAVTSTPAPWPVPGGWQDAYDFAQARRAEAEILWKKKDPAGIDELMTTLRYLDQPLVRDLAAGNKYLAARRYNIFMDLAQAYAIQGQNELSLNYLRQVVHEAPHGSLATLFEQESDFAGLRDNAEFRRILSELRLFDSLWDSPALKTPYQQNLSDPQKIAGLSKFWSEVKYNFGYPEKLIALNWDQLYLDWIPRVLATKSTTDYYRELMLLCVRLNDGHTNVYAPAESDILAKPPLRTGLVEGRVMILEVRSPRLEAQGIHAGMEIVSVDGEAAQAYARRDVEPYQSASTPQDRELRTYWYGFLRGPASKPVRLTLRDAQGKQAEVDLNRTGYTDIRSSEPFAWHMLDNNVAYVALNSFESDQTVKQWREVFPEISKASGIVLDLRTNGGGSTNVGFAILQDLVATPFQGSAQRMRLYEPTERAHGSVIEFTNLAAYETAPRPNGYTAKPVVVLAGPATFSAAEDFLVAWKGSGRGKIIGEPSGGSTGQPLFFSLPGGGSARVCTKKDTFPDGTEWVGKGIDPDILVRSSVADVQAGKDAVLDRALAYLTTSR